MPAPGLAFVGNLQFCEGGSIVLSAIAVPMVTYQWYRNGFPIGGATDSVYEAKISGNYSVSISSPHGCSFSSHMVQVTVYPNPTPPIVKNGLILSTSVYNTYQWYRNNAPIPGANSQSHHISQTGAYLVEVTTPDGCLNRSPLFTVTSLSTKTITANKDIKVFPNPTQNKLFIEAPYAVNIVVLNQVGQTVINVKDSKEVDLSSFANGVYTLMITNENNELITREKVVKTN